MAGAKTYGPVCQNTAEISRMKGENQCHHVYNAGTLASNHNNSLLRYTVGTCTLDKCDEVLMVRTNLKEIHQLSIDKSSITW